jgi:hypothetical protein
MIIHLPDGNESSIRSDHSIHLTGPGDLET